ncbi:restriction endonuclease subunit S [Shewanella sp. SG44-6]|uniref:restriction endonuclease subunit S n=1 Tax=Shewanella sp. SG44-6 TaxID=2760959 RepID=UPI0015FEF490|nr:restriction endonuclease subunit S [Shewanella sp. SG44-6]MBB1390467.1 restriction endonuclease subunit S [Shewanella sp. SG44-6]
MADLSTPTNDGQSEQTSDNLITQHIDIWTTAIEQKSSAGRGSSKKFSLFGIKKLRELILELAVRGKLVPQDVNDEPASVLLERIAAEKAQLVKEGKLKKQKPLPEIGEDEKPFELPQGWAWSRLGDIATASTGYAFKSSQYTNNGTFVLRVTNINPDGTIDRLDNKFIDPILADSEFSKFLLCENDVLMVMVGGSLGKVGIVSKNVLPAVLNQNMWKLSQFGGIPVPFFQCILEFVNNNQITITASTHGHLAQGDYLSKLVPTPPLEEQHRIVAKVDELMSLCDALEAQTEASISAHQTLVETLLNALLQPNITQQKDSQSACPEPSFADSLEPAFNDSFIDSWQRVTEHFDTLFTTEASIDTLKQTILQLAVMGKLVPQNANDEPAAKLVERIAAVKAQLIKDGKIKKQKPLPAITDEEKPFELPQSWEWYRLGTLYSFLNGFAFKSEWFQPDGIKLLRNINIAHSETKWGDQACIPSSLAAEYEKYRLSAGDIVISLDRPIINTGLKYAVIEQSDLPCLLLQRVAKFHSYADTVTPKYLSRWLESDLFMSAIDPGRSNGVPHISTKQLEEMVFPLCSLEEQHRIVAKVDELMALCDQLKARLSDAQTTQLHLTDAIVEQAV